MEIYKVREKCAVCDNTDLNINNGIWKSSVSWEIFLPVIRIIK